MFSALRRSSRFCHTRPHTPTAKDNLAQVVLSKLGSEPWHIYSLLPSTQSSRRLISLWASEEGCPWQSWCTSYIRKKKEREREKKNILFLDSKGSPVGLGFYWFIHGKATTLLLWQAMGRKRGGGKKKLVGMSNNPRLMEQQMLNIVLIYSGPAVLMAV